MKKEWRLTPSATGGAGGSGCAGLSAKGIAGRVGAATVTANVEGAGGDSQAGGASGVGGGSGGPTDAEMDDLKKIRKVQGFFRGWLCRHRWKVIVEEYIKSPHAESMRKRNRSVSFSLHSSTFLCNFFFPNLFFTFVFNRLVSSSGCWKTKRKT